MRALIASQNAADPRASAGVDPRMKEVLVWRANADLRPREGDNVTTTMTGRGAASGGPHDAP